MRCYYQKIRVPEALCDDTQIISQQELDSHSQRIKALFHLFLLACIRSSDKEAAWLR